MSTTTPPRFVTRTFLYASEKMGYQMHRASFFKGYAWTAAILVTCLATHAHYSVRSAPAFIEMVSRSTNVSPISAQRSGHLRQDHNQASALPREQEARRCTLDAPQGSHCVRSCMTRKPRCLNINCNHAVFDCDEDPTCCMSVKINQSAAITTVCYNGCCFALDDSRNEVTPYACKPKVAGCFPISAFVELVSGQYQRLDQLALGDLVRVSESEFSDVFMFTHRLPRSSFPFAVIRLISNHTIELTDGHYIYVNRELKPAAFVKLGDELWLSSGERSKVISVSKSIETGLYNPQTMHGDIDVNGVISSTYTTAVSPVHGHALHVIFRLLYRGLGLKLAWRESGAEFFHRFLPVHSSVE